MLTESVGVVGEGVTGGSVEWTEMESVVSLKKGLECGEVSEGVVRGGATVGNVGGSRGKSTVSVRGGSAEGVVAGLGELYSAARPKWRAE